MFSYQVESEQLCRINQLVACNKPGWQARADRHELSDDGLVKVALASFLQACNVTLEKTPSGSNGCAGASSVVVDACLAWKNGWNRFQN